ncbi:CDK5 and ABL1 enzyme substrate 2 isoform X3 [Orcinus orca]|uniref:CDK5 and ABL1 enzyme substrate 2 isoform X3 n=1 Tax=Orcinus orca TaxID=9733 RepID=UPI0021136273|nr:CDK5 and ABL1 enzyme substrate 2 isoform X3 [Orcinus orca]
MGGRDGDIFAYGCAPANGRRARAHARAGGRWRAGGGLSRRMAAAAAGGSSDQSPGPAARAAPQALRRRGDSRRRQAALFFLNNISLDGRPPSLGPGGEKPPPPPPPTEAREPPAPPPPPPPPPPAPPAGLPLPGPAGRASAPQGLLSPAPAPAGLGLGLSLGLDGQRQRRRVGSQRCSLEFLEDTVGCASLQRTKHTSGSPRHKGLKKTHFIKNMRQYDTKNSRIVLICAKRSLCAAFSVLPYGEGLRVSDLRVDSQKQRHPSGGVSVSSEMVFQLEGVELGADGKGCPLLAGADAGDALEYNPDLLDDPQWPCGKHKRVLIFASYMTTVIEYVKPSDLKKDMNETFREKFPHIKLTLSKIRSLKREMWNLSEESGLEPVTVSMAYVYFEKLILQGKVNKQNRKLCAGACVLLAAKISSDLRKNDVKQLIDKLEEKFRFNRRDLIGFEFTVLVALELALYLPENQVLPHYRRLTQQF